MGATNKFPFDKDHISNLLEKFPTEELKQDTYLIYKDHVPLASFYIIQGDIFLKDSKGKDLKKLSPNEFIGVEENLSNKPFAYTLFAKANSKLIIINRNMLKELIYKSTTQGI